MPTTSSSALEEEEEERGTNIPGRMMTYAHSYNPTNNGIQVKFAKV
jgi:hypothetical protein